MGRRESDPSRERSRHDSVTEEDIVDYLAKKAHKNAIKVATKLNTQTSYGYANESNPFGDSNLNVRFVWRKKIERDVTRGSSLSLDEFSVKAEKKRQREIMAEIEKVKRRREERAIGKARHEEELALLARERARAEFRDWEEKEVEFHYDQCKIRSEIRSQQGRMKPFDVLVKLLNPSDDVDIEVDEPYAVFEGLRVEEIEELRDEIKMCSLGMGRGSAPTDTRYWEALLVVCDWELAEARRKVALDRARVHGEPPPAEGIGLHSSIEADVNHLLQGKSYSELEALRSRIESQMRSGTAKVVEYWEEVVKRLHVYEAKAYLKEFHRELLPKHLGHLEEVGVPVSSEPRVNEEPTEEEDDDAGSSYSPELIHGDENEEAIVDPEEDRAVLERKRSAVVEKQRMRLQEAAPSEGNLELRAAMKAMGAMEEGDATFGDNDEVNLDSQAYWWHDKYRPRKPKYFNCVHTGYEWNQYNRTHYDHDNPPPRIVQGYKFNIFYPDLIDKTKAPTCTLEKDGDSTETCIIRFHAGPPYEDIAFRIVNKEWECKHKKGFKHVFERGVLQVYFNFKRHRYHR